MGCVVLLYFDFNNMLVGDLEWILRKIVLNSKNMLYLGEIEVID